VDTLAGLTYSLSVGTLFDITAGLDLMGVLYSRLFNVSSSTITAGIIGKYRNIIYSQFKTTKQSSRFKQYFTELFCFNTAVVPLYGVSLTIASFFSEWKFNLDEAVKGMKYLAEFSPALSPFMGWYFDRVRKLFGVRSAAESYEKIE